MNFKLLDFALHSLVRRKGRYPFIYITFTLLIAVSLSIFTITGALKQEAQYSLNNLPDIIVQKISGGRQQYIKKQLAEDIIMLPGVISAVPRIWGFYPFEYLNTNLTIVGVDIYDPYVTETLAKITKDISPLKFNRNIFLGEKLHEIIRQIYNKDEFSFQMPDGTYKTLEIAGTFQTSSQMISTDTVITDMLSAAEILGIPAGFSTDIAVNSANSQEISTIAEKILNISPSLKVVTKDFIKASYQNMFDYKGGIFLLFFITSLFTFFMIIFDRLNGPSGGELKEIAILKALGWGTSDILKVKLYEASVIGLFSYLTAICLSLIYVYVLHAPGLKDVFMGYSYLKPSFSLPFVFDIRVVVTVFLITVPVYGSAVIIPAWRAASTSAEVIR